MEYYSAIKNNEIMPSVATQMDPEIIILSEVSQTKTNILQYYLYVESKKKKKDTNELLYKAEINSHRKQTYSYQSRKQGVQERDKLGV